MSPVPVRFSDTLLKRIDAHIKLLNSDGRSMSRSAYIRTVMAEHLNRVSPPAGENANVRPRVRMDDQRSALP